MLNNISWASYAYAISIILIIYYVLVIAIYFRKGVRGLLSRQSKRLANPVEKDMPPIQDSGNNASNEVIEKTATSETNELLLSLQSLIKKAAARKYVKEELLQSIQLKLQNYPVLKDSQLTGSINNFIKAESENNCSIHLSDDEVKVLWGVEVGGAS